MFKVNLIGSTTLDIDADGFKVTPDNHLVFYVTHTDGTNSTTFMAAADKWIYFELLPD